MRACEGAASGRLGRAIRHAGDYAVMLLLDERYCRPGVRARLPTWIGDQFASAASAADAEDRVRAVRRSAAAPGRHGPRTQLTSRVAPFARSAVRTQFFARRGR